MLSAKNATPRIGRNLMWLIWSGTISIANSLLLWIFIAQMRDVEEVGRFTIVLGLYTLFVGICSLGLIPFLVSEISRRQLLFDEGSPESEAAIHSFISSASVVLFMSGLACTLLMAISGFLVSESWTVRISTLILSLAMIPTGLIDVGEAVSVSLNKTRLIAISTTFENLLRTVIPFGLIWYNYNIWLVFASFVAVRVGALLIYGWAARNKIKYFNPSSIYLRHILKAVPVFGGTIILASINWQAVIILLGIFSTEIEAAKYGVASRFLIPVSIFMASYSSVIQPVITQYYERSPKDAGTYLSKLISYPLILATLAAIISPFLSRTVISFLFGDVYAEVSATLDILAISVIPFSIIMVVARGLVAANSQRIDLIANGVGVAVCIVSGVFLIPKYGAVGAAIVQLMSFVAMALLETIYLSKKMVSFRVWQTAGLSTAVLLLTHLIFWKP